MSPRDQRPILALDLGTTSAKAVLIGADHAIHAAAERRITTFHPRPGLAEQDAEQCLRAAADAVAELLHEVNEPPAALALSSAMHSVVPLDEDGGVLGPMRIWADARGAEVAERLRSGDRCRALQERTGTPLGAFSPMCKIAAIREQEPELFAATAHFVSLKELLLRRWCGAEVVDASMASTTGLRDLASGTWDRGALEIAGVTPARLSRIVPPRTVLTAGADSPLPETPVVVGAADGCLANLGVGATEPGVVAVSLGTSGAARALVRRPRVDPDSGLFCYLLDEDEWVIGGAVNDAGNTLAWAAEMVCADAPSDDRVERLLALAADAEPGARGVRFVAHLGGTRFPSYDSAARGGFWGLSVAHDRRDLARAVVEGIVEGIAGVVDALREQGCPVREVRAGGGLFRSSLFSTLLEQRVRAAVVVAETVEVSALGAALLAERALGATP